MKKISSFAVALIAGMLCSTVSWAAEITITAPVLSVYDDGFRMADERTQVVRVFAWNLCGDNTRDHISRGDWLTVTGDREWRMVDATSVNREDGTPACPADAAPRY